MSDVFDDVVYKRVFQISGGRVDLLDESTRDFLDTSQTGGHSLGDATEEEEIPTENKNAA